MSNVRIAVVGSLMLDLVVRVSRLPVLGESLFGQEFGMFVGGKGGNQALAAARLGASVHMIGRVGDDPFGERIVATLSAGGVDCRHVARDPAIGTGVAMPMVFDGGGNSIISIPRANLAMSVADIEAARDVIAGSSMLLVQFEVAMDATEAAMRLARKAGVPILLNPAPIAPVPAGILGLADYLVPNEVEARALVPGAGADPEAQARALLGHGSRVVVVTLGEAGAVAATASGVERVAAYQVAAVDSVGAGDAFCGAFALALCEGREPGEAVRFGNAAGAISVTRRGAAASLPTREEVRQLVDRGELRS
jgi:ribokinase